MARPEEYYPETHIVVDDNGDVKPDADFIEPAYTDPYAKPRKDNGLETHDPVTLVEIPDAPILPQVYVPSIEAQPQVKVPAPEADQSSKDARYWVEYEKIENNYPSGEAAHAELARRGYVLPE
jgi:hypothetical protein